MEAVAWLLDSGLAVIGVEHGAVGGAGKAAPDLVQGAVQADDQPVAGHGLIVLLGHQCPAAGADDGPGFLGQLAAEIHANVCEPPPDAHAPARIG